MLAKNTVLIVDDEPINLSVLTHILINQYQVRAANSGQRALEVAVTDPKPDIILLDIMMPEMDGYEVVSKLKENPQTSDIPVIFVTAMDDVTDEELGFELGAVDYIAKPIRPAILLARVKAHLTLKQASDFLQDQNSFLEAEINRRMKENLNIQNVSIRALAHLSETRDPETGEHIMRTQHFIKILAQNLQHHPRFKHVIDDSYINLVTRSAPLHDIGKVGIPDHILLKPGALTNEEWQVMKTHAELGAKAIEQAEKDVEQSLEFLSLAKEIAHWHHEKWDGSGYPDGLSEEDIPVSARLMALADVFDALTTPRVYKEACSFAKAREIIIDSSGSHFDPAVVDAFLQVYEQFVAIARQYSSE